MGAVMAVRRGWSAALVGAAVVLSASVSTPVARADVPFPDADPFYAAPADLAGLPNGALLGSRPISLFGLPIPVSAWQLRYRTTDSRNKPILDVTTVIVPPIPWAGARPVLSYQIPEDSLGTRCAPSYALRGGRDLGVVNTLIDVPFLTETLRRGWAVVISDYEGPQSRFFDGVTAARGVLDGVRAARAFAPAGIAPTSPIGAYGYSGGAYATLWAAQLRAVYAPDVVFAGISAGGIPADIPAIARRVDGGQQAGLAMLILLALARNEPESGLADLLNERGRAALAENANACGSDLVPKYFGARMDDFATVPNILAHPAFLAAAAKNEVGTITPDTPMYLYHSVTDDVIPVPGFSNLIARYCAAGATQTAVHSQIPGHNGSAVGEFLGGMNYLSDRFAGLPPARGCHVR
ncbi:lipase family protein [Nocardia sp. CDC159]|uniref:Lipase family protein n=1 Tax=Nocardia pulmonis TaxID=2951408 RepID=A0A9X2E2S0_9NOCA|nr:MULTISPECIES: lipase family protein [Nocardia]MCM6773072.1 lipase family protein [Nocardia pulmonis]MCM6785625.1 lipase family protein [Nocardia sp. CDC159]